MDAPISKSQIRALEVTGTKYDGDSYNEAAAALEAAGFWRDGIPAGLNWREAKKLSDAELLALLPQEDLSRPTWDERLGEI